MLILLVDDDEDCRHIYRLALEHAGHTVILAMDGAEGLEKGRTVKPDLILMDIAMPKVGGFEAVQVLRGAAPTKGLLVVALTAAAAYEDAAVFRERGFDGLLTKPLSPGDLVAAVERLSRGKDPVTS